MLMTCSLESPALIFMVFLSNVPQPERKTTPTAKIIFLIVSLFIGMHNLIACLLGIVLLDTNTFYFF